VNYVLKPELCLNTSLYLQEDTTPSRLKVKNSTVKFLLSQSSYLQTLLVSVFTPSGAVALSRNAPLCFLFVVLCFVFSGPTHILCLGRDERVKQGTMNANISPLLRHKTLYSVLGAYRYATQE
jgi:hypothetical protein